MEINKFVRSSILFMLTLGLTGFSGCKKTGINEPKGEFRTRFNKPKSFNPHHRPEIKSKEDADKYFANKPSEYKKELEKLVSKDKSNIDLTLALADCYKNEKIYLKAATTYKVCSTYQPESENLLSANELASKQEYARFNEVFCRGKFSEKIKDECDLTPLDDVMLACDHFCKDYSSSLWTKEVLAIKSACNIRKLYKIQSTFDNYCNNWKRNASMLCGEIGSDEIAATKVLEKMKKDFNLEEKDVAARIAFSEFKISKIKYEVAMMQTQKYLAQESTIVSRAIRYSNGEPPFKKGIDEEKLLELREIEHNAKESFLAKYSKIDNDFLDTKEHRTASIIVESLIG